MVSKEWMKKQYPLSNTPNHNPLWPRSTDCYIDPEEHTDVHDTMRMRTLLI